MYLFPWLSPTAAVWVTDLLEPEILCQQVKPRNRLGADLKVFNALFLAINIPSEQCCRNVPRAEIIHVYVPERKWVDSKKSVSKSGSMIIHTLIQRQANTLEPAGSLIHSAPYKEA